MQFKTFAAQPRSGQFRAQQPGHQRAAPQAAAEDVEKGRFQRRSVVRGIAGRHSAAVQVLAGELAHDARAVADGEHFQRPAVQQRRGVGDGRG
jgi:hypothetical protein